MAMVDEKKFIESLNKYIHLKKNIRDNLDYTPEEQYDIQYGMLYNFKEKYRNLVNDVIKLVKPSIEFINNNIDKVHRIIRFIEENKRIIINMLDLLNNLDNKNILKISSKVIIMDDDAYINLEKHQQLNTTVYYKDVLNELDNIKDEYKDEYKKYYDMQIFMRKIWKRENRTNRLYTAIGDLFNLYQNPKQINSHFSGHDCDFKDGLISYFNGEYVHSIQAGMGKRISLVFKIVFKDNIPNPTETIEEREFKFFKQFKKYNIEEEINKLINKIIIVRDKDEVDIQEIKIQIIEILNNNKVDIQILKKINKTIKDNLLFLHSGGIPNKEMDNKIKLLKNIYMQIKQMINDRYTNKYTKI
jgi:hypothetical protein